MGQWESKECRVVIKRAVYMIAKHVHYFDELSYSFIKYFPVPYLFLFYGAFPSRLEKFGCARKSLNIATFIA